jgi:hypothetical protein
MNLHYMVGSNRTLLSHSFGTRVPGSHGRFIEDGQFCRNGGSYSTSWWGIGISLARLHGCYALATARELGSRLLWENPS